MAQRDIQSADLESLARLVDQASPQQRLWRAEELDAILRHQLSAPVYFDMKNLDQGLARRVEALCKGQGLLLRSFRDLLQHPNPPIELLEITKDFAKALAIQPHSPVPHEIAMMLYFAAITAAMVRCQRRITALGNQELRDNLEWLDGQPWVDAETRHLLQEGRALLDHERGQSS